MQMPSKVDCCPSFILLERGIRICWKELYVFKSTVSCGGISLSRLSKPLRPPQSMLAAVVLLASLLTNHFTKCPSAAGEVKKRFWKVMWYETLNDKLTYI